MQPSNALITFSSTTPKLSKSTSWHQRHTPWHQWRRSKWHKTVDWMEMKLARSQIFRNHVKNPARCCLGASQYHDDYGRNDNIMQQSIGWEMTRGQRHAQPPIAAVVIPITTPTTTTPRFYSSPSSPKSKQSRSHQTDENHQREGCGCRWWLAGLDRRVSLYVVSFFWSQSTQISHTSLLYLNYAPLCAGC